MIINAFKDKIFPLSLEGFFEVQDEDRFYSEKLAPIPEFPDFEEKTLRDMPDLESEESAEQRRNQSARGLKTLTPQEMLSRLPISFAQLEARNNSEKLKNEIRQLLNSLHRSKKLRKTIYNNLINAI